MATVNYPELLPHPLVSDGYGFRSNQSQAVSLFDVETQSRDETRTVNVGFTFTDLQYKVFHGWFMNVLIHGQKWFNMRLDGEFYECTFGGVQPQYSLNRKIITVTATIKTRPSTGFVNYTNQRVSYPNAVNYMPSPFNPEGWSSDLDGTILNTALANPSGEDFVGLCEQVTTGGFVVNQTGDETEPVVSGDRYYAAIISKSLTNDNGLRLRLEFDDTFFGAFSFNQSDGSIIALEGAANPSSYVVEYIGDGFFLFQCYFTADADYSEFNMQFFMCNEANSLIAPNIGSQLYAQAAFFGKTGKYQGAISYNAVNYMPSPFDPSGWSSDADGTILNTVLANPSGEAFVGLCEQTTAGGFIINQTGDQIEPVVSGDKYYAAIIGKSLTNDNGLRLRLEFDDTFFGAFSFNQSDGSIIALEGAANPSSYVVEDIGDGFFLFQCYFTADADYSEFNMQFFMCGKEDNLSAPSIGSKLYAQAAYFGKADDWPAIITPADPDQFPAAITYEY